VILILFSLFGALGILFCSNYYYSNPLSNDNENLKTQSSSINYSNATIISDGFNNSYWNDGNSFLPAIAVDSKGNIHAVWYDYTNGKWGTDSEIMHAKFDPSTGWSNITVISDGYNGSYWNDDNSYNPAIAIDSQDNIHVVWHDNTNGVWGIDTEIMYVKYSPSMGWSNVTVISDGYNGSYWNDGNSYYPNIAVDSQGNVHVVWQDYTDGVWGTDTEIMYVKYSPSTGWSNVTIISDGYGGSYWNDGNSYFPDIAIDSRDNVHVVWYDNTDGAWGTDLEIMHVQYDPSMGWSNASIVSDLHNFMVWNDGSSVYPSIYIDSQDTCHIVWQDDTDTLLGVDIEIMYSYLTPSGEWSFPEIISDGYNNTSWNDGNSNAPSIAGDVEGKLFVVWHDGTDGKWGTDLEIMFVLRDPLTGWSNVTVISDGFGGSYWNVGSSYYADIAVIPNGNVHVVWYDLTDGKWGIDNEIMHVEIENQYKQSTGVIIPLGNYYIIYLIVILSILLALTNKKIKRII